MIDRETDSSPADEAPIDAAALSSADIGQVAGNTSRKLLVLLALGAIGFLLIHFTSFGEQLRNWDSLTTLFKGGGLRAELSFLLISALLMTIGTPRLLFWGVAGFAFGFWPGLFWSSCSSLLGSYLGFRAARWGGRAWLTERFGKNRFFSRIVAIDPTIASVILIRLLPVSNAIANVGLALGKVSSRSFLIGSLIGFLPQGVVALIIGSGMADDVPWAGAMQIAIAGTLLAVILWWAKRQGARRELTQTPQTPQPPQSIQAPSSHD